MKIKNDLYIIIKTLIFFLFLSKANAQQESTNNQQVPIKEKQRSYRLGAYFQVRSTTYEDNFGDNTFQIKRARLEFKGNVNSRVKYHLQFDAMQNPILKDARISFFYIPYVEVKVGQYKVPFSLEELTPAYDFDFVENPDVVKTLAPFRDIGLSFRSDFTYINAEAGIFNGNGEKNQDNNKKKDFNARR